MILDGHCHIGKSVYGFELSTQDLIRRMDASAIDRAVISPFTPWDLDWRRANEEVAAAASQFPDRLIAFAAVDPRRVDLALAEIDYAVGELGIAGVRLDPLEQGFKIDSRGVRPVFEDLARRDVVAFVEAGAAIVCAPVQLAAVAARFPELRIIAAHAGQMEFSGLGQWDVLNMMERCPNVYAETSGVYEVSSHGVFNKIVTRIGPGRMVFGSDSPRGDLGVELCRVKAAYMPEEEMEAILGGTMIRLLEK